MREEMNVYIVERDSAILMVPSNSHKCPFPWQRWNNNRDNVVKGFCSVLAFINILKEFFLNNINKRAVHWSHHRAIKGPIRNHKYVDYKYQHNIMGGGKGGGASSCPFLDPSPNIWGGGYHMFPHILIPLEVVHVSIPLKSSKLLKCLGGGQQVVWLFLLHLFCFPFSL